MQKIDDGAMHKCNNNLSYYLERDNNNYDIVRLIAACLVIYGHANAMIPAHLAGVDVVSRFIAKFDYSGALAVKVFFFLSGLVVTNSLIEKGNVTQFAIARLFRIWPALLFVLLFSVFVLGVFLTSLDLSAYLLHPETRGYIFNNTLMKIVFELPGVFQEDLSGPLNHRAINGSLWSLPYEVGAYLGLVAFFMLGASKYKKIAILILCLFLLDVFLEKRILFPGRLMNPTVDDLAPFFGFGALLALFKDKIVVNIKMVAAFGVILYLFQNSLYSRYVFYVFVFIFIIYFFSRAWIVKLKLKFDISYGVYIWGWPVQQVLAHQFPNLSFGMHIILATFIACAAGTFSWFFIEKPSIDFGRKFYRRISSFVNIKI